MQKDLIERILKLKEERNALILAHNYQPDEIQDLADYVGDSFGLSQQAAETDKNVIVFCGVYFMAEGAAILSPEKTVLLPDPEAGCPLADTISAESLKEAKKKHPHAAVVCYINSPAAVKAESDICCTSSNAVKIAESVSASEILFVPDKNLAHWVAHQSQKKIIPWEGCCPTHDCITPFDIEKIREQHPGIPVAIHPECPPSAVEKADFVGSTGAILDFARKTADPEIVIVTEKGILHRLKQENPEKDFILLSPKLICPTMKQISLEKVLRSLENMETIIKVPEETRKKAEQALRRMLAVK